MSWVKKWASETDQDDFDTDLKRSEFKIVIINLSQHKQIIVKDS